MDIHHIHTTIFKEDEFISKAFAKEMPILSDVTKCGSNMPDALALNINANIMRINSGEFKSEELGGFLASLHEMWDRIHFYNISKFDFMPIVINIHARIGISTPIMQEVISYLDRMGVLDRILKK